MISQLIKFLVYSASSVQVAYEVIKTIRVQRFGISLLIPVILILLATLSRKICFTLVVVLVYHLLSKETNDGASQQNDQNSDYPSYEQQYWDTLDRIERMLNLIDVYNKVYEKVRDFRTQSTLSWKMIKFVISVYSADLITCLLYGQIQIRYFLMIPSTLVIIIIMFQSLRDVLREKCIQ